MITLVKRPIPQFLASGLFMCISHRTQTQIKEQRLRQLLANQAQLTQQLQIELIKNNCLMRPLLKNSMSWQSLNRKKKSWKPN